MDKLSKKEAEAGDKVLMLVFAVVTFPIWFSMLVHICEVIIK